MNKWYMFMSFTMQNYNKYFNVASDITIFLNNRTFYLKKTTTSGRADGYNLFFLAIFGFDDFVGVARQVA